jgi:expansin (peptidoglycan-binding protein)
VGALKAEYRRVDCPVVGDIAYHIRKESNPYWILITVLNVGGPGSVSEVWVKGSESGSEWFQIYVSATRSFVFIFASCSRDISMKFPMLIFI